MEISLSEADEDRRKELQCTKTKRTASSVPRGQKTQKLALLAKAASIPKTSAGDSGLQSNQTPRKPPCRTNRTVSVVTMISDTANSRIMMFIDDQSRFETNPQYRSERTTKIYKTFFIEAETSEPPRT
jgi:hypothetical protein